MSNPYEKYKNNAVSSLSQEQLVIMLVEGAVKYTKVARLALEKGDLERANKELIRVQNIYGELIASMDTNAGDFAKELVTIYACIKKKLVEANVKKDVAIVDEVLPLIEQVRDVWCAVKKDYDQKKY
jgi:flagellar protein FliS